MPDDTPNRFHNLPPLVDYFKEQNDTLPEYLAADCKTDIDRTNEMVKNAAEIPPVITNEVDEAKATDIVSQMNKHAKLLDARRLGITSGPRTSKDIIDGFFKTKGIDPLTAAVARIEPAVTKWKRLKAENERREREERERLAREEAERQRKAAEEAERKKREAEAAAKAAQEEERRAKEAAAKAKAEEAAAKERQRLAEIAQKEAEQRAAEAETKRKREQAEREARKQKEAAEQAERDRAAAQERQRLEREKATAAKTEASITKAEVADANREVKTATNIAKHAESDVRKAERATGAKLSEVSGVRGDYGGHSSLRTRWVGRITNRKTLDLEALREFMSEDDMQKALNKFVSVHKGDRKLRGAQIEEESDTTFR